jgi:hypothetical protein
MDRVRDGYCAKTADAPLRSPGFPVETRGFDDLYAALFTESRTRGRRWQREIGNPGRSGRDDKGRVATFREMATWMDRFRHGSSAKTADPCAPCGPAGSVFTTEY